MNLIQRVGAALRVMRGVDPVDSALASLYPELARRQNISTWMVRGEDVPPDVSKSLAVYYEIQVWTRKAIDVIANNLAPLLVRVVDGDGQALDAHPVSLLLDYVNDQMSPADLWRQWVIDMMTEGEEGWELVLGSRGTYAEIWPRVGHSITVVPDQSVIDYWGVAAYKIASPANPTKTTRVTPDDFIFFKFYNPLNPWRGLSPISALMLSVDLDLAAQEWSKKAFRRGGHWDFALKTPQGITASERARIEARFSALYMGASDAAFPVLEEGMEEVIPLNWAPQDMEWATQRSFSREEIGAIFGVPDEIMGFGKDTYENFENAHKVLWQLSLVPLAGIRDSALTEFFRGVGLLNITERVATDFSDVQVLKNDITGSLDGAAVLLEHGVPFNIVSEHLGLGFPTLPGGDIGYISFNRQPVMAAPGVSVPEREAPSEAEPEELLRVHGPLLKNAILPDGAISNLPEYESDEHVHLLAVKGEQVQPTAARMKAMLRADFERQRDAIKARLLAQKAYADAVFSLDEEVRVFEGEYEQLLTILFADVGQEELSQIIADFEFDMGNNDVQAAIASQLKAFALKVNSTTFTDLIEIFQFAEDEGYSIDQIVEQLGEYYDERMKPYQLERIARTTLGGAQNAAAIEAYRQSGVASGSQWISALLSVTRPAHRAAHGQYRALGELFFVGGEYIRYPGDPDGSAGNIVNCLCSVIPVIEGDL